MAFDSTNAHEMLQMIGEGDLSVLKTLRHMTEGTFQESGLEPETFILCRIAALAAIDAAPASWLVNLKAAGDIEVDPEHVVGTIVAIAPVIGTARVVSAASNAVRAIALSKVRERMR